VLFRSLLSGFLRIDNLHLQLLDLFGELALNLPQLRLHFLQLRLKITFLALFMLIHTR
jgi:hypothetical protein